MKLVFLTNLIHHHQIPLADEFFKILGDNYKYITTAKMPQFLITGGYQSHTDKPYLIRLEEAPANVSNIQDLINGADVVIIGSAPENLVTERIKSGKLTFRYNERWFKSKPWYLTRPLGWLNFYKNHIRYKNKPLYMLAASAYTANDVYAIGAYKNKCFKWGYFTQVDSDLKVEAPQNLGVSTSEITPLMWCSRFLKWKHPELPVLLAQRLKEDGYKFVIDMFGSGEELDATMNLAKTLGVEDVVKFRGNLPNQEILNEMRQHEIFLFTSDRNEGWGAVLNESMTNGCAVVASNLIGSVPFLIKDEENGVVFQSGNIDSLYQTVKLLLDNSELRNTISKNAIKTMREVWNPQNAAKRFLQLVKALQNETDSPFIDGPCSKALPTKSNITP